MRPKNDFICSGNAGRITGHPGDVSVCLRLHRIQNLNEVGNFSLRESVFQYETALVPVSVGLSLSDLLIRRFMLRPDKVSVQRVYIHNSILMSDRFFGFAPQMQNTCAREIRCRAADQMTATFAS